ncbi:MAG: alpha/beta hydrolase [Bacteroidetes bacterium]|nr:alpha/beta hydrolase [Bacteroidota bacterium]
MKVSKLNSRQLALSAMAILLLSACEKNNEDFNNTQPSTSSVAEFAISADPDFVHVPDSGRTFVFGSSVQSQTFAYGSDSVHQAEFFTSLDGEDGPRPLIILAPGGGFTSYTEMPKLRQFATSLALKGYQAAVVKYSGGSPDYNTITKANQDLRSSIRFFRLNAEQYKVDTANIFIGGWSSGAMVAFITAYMDSSEISGIVNPTHRMLVSNAVNTHGFDNNDNPGASTKVRGYLGMFTYSFDKNMIDRSDAAMMLINHWDTHFTDGTRIIGTYTYANLPGYGTDPIANTARQRGFVDGQDLEYIRIAGASKYKTSNYAPLYHGYYPQIFDFIERNTK